MDLRVTVDLTGRGLQNPRPRTLGESEHIDGPMHTGFGRLDGVMLIVHRRGRAGEVVDLIHLKIQRERHIMTN